MLGCGAPSDALAEAFTDALAEGLGGGGPPGRGPCANAAAVVVEIATKSDVAALRMATA
jgi:hypothetical protein